MKLTPEALQAIRDHAQKPEQHHNILLRQSDCAALLRHVEALEAELAARCPPDCLSHPSGFYELELNKLRAELAAARSEQARLRRSIA